MAKNKKVPFSNLTKEAFKTDEVTSNKTLLMIQMAKDLGFDAYWDLDLARFGNTPDNVYENIKTLVEAGWTKKLDE
jgi:hypothetical protein